MTQEAATKAFLKNSHYKQKIQIPEKSNLILESIK
jgi:hypothetical protein